MSITASTTSTIVSQPVSVSGFPSANMSVVDDNVTTWAKMDTSTLALTGSDVSVLPPGMTTVKQVYVKVNGRANVKLTPTGGSEITVPVQNFLLIRDTSIGFSNVKVNGSGEVEVVIFGE